MNYVILGILGLVSILSIKRPVVAMLLFVISMTLPSFVRIALDIPYLNDISFYFGLMCVSLILSPLSGARYEIKIPQHFLLPFFVLLLFIFFSAIRAAYVTEVSYLRAIASYFIYPILTSFGVYLVSYNLFFHHDNKVISRYIGYSILLIVVSCLYDQVAYFFMQQNYDLGLVPPSLGSRKVHCGYLMGCNAVGATLLVALPFVWCALKKNQVASKWVIAILLGISVAILVTRARAAILAFMLFILFLMITSKQISNKKKLQLSVFIFLPILFAFYAFKIAVVSNTYPGQPWVELFEKKYIYHIIDVYSGFRLNIWEHAIQELSGLVFWIGKGAGNFLVNWKGTLLGSHNHFLRVWGEAGVFAFLSLTFLYGSILSLAWRSWRMSRDFLKNISGAVLCALLGVLFVGLFAHFSVGAIQTTYLWILVGWFVAELKKQETDK